MIRIDYEKCIGCLSCTDKCVCAAIVTEDGRPVYKEEVGCIRCMHCAIACPENAITFDDKSAILCEELPLASEHLADDLETLVLTRRSYRNFKEEMVPPEEISRILGLTAWVPSSSNSHPVEYCMVSGREAIGRMMDIIEAYIKETGLYENLLPRFKKGINPVVTNAPNLILAYTSDEAWNPQTDVAIALTTAELMLQSRGIGTCWAGYLHGFLNKIPELKAMTGVPDGYTFHGCLLVGYPTEEYHYIPERVKKPGIKEIR